MKVKGHILVKNSYNLLINLQKCIILSFIKTTCILETLIINPGNCDFAILAIFTIFVTILVITKYRYICIHSQLQIHISNLDDGEIPFLSNSAEYKSAL